MTEWSRCAAGVTLAAFCAFIPGRIATRAETSDWQIGDLFVGVGWVDYLSGQYWVYDSSGQRRLVAGQPEVLTHEWAVSKGASVGVSTGCMLSPRNTPDDGALYTTSFHGLTVGRFEPLSPHGFSLANTISYSAGPVTIVDASGRSRTVDWSVFAIETIMFDRQGNYYVGGQGPPPNDSVEEGTAYTRPAFVFRFNSNHILETTFEVPNGKRGVDQIDIGSDWNYSAADNTYYPTIYYTSEDTTIRIFRPWLTGDDRYGELQVREITEQPIQGSLYAIRALPPNGVDFADTPEDDTQLPSGYLVASSADVLRLDRKGVIVRRFVAEGIAGQRFALNITPDGQSFWTATYPDGDVDYPTVVTPGYLLKFHIPSPEVGATAVVPISAGAVWGLCIKREYTAGINTCYVTDTNGRPVDRNGDGEPDTQPCRVPEVCGNSVDNDVDGVPDAGDEDGDGKMDAADPDCSRPGAPVIVPPPDRVSTEGDVIPYNQAVTIGVNDLQRHPLPADEFTFTVSGYPTNLQARKEDGAIKIWSADGPDGYVHYDQAGTPRTVRITVMRGPLSSAASFTWEVLHRNGPPTLSDPPDQSVAVGRSAAFVVDVGDPDYDSVDIRYTTNGQPGLPPGFTGPSVAGPGLTYSFSISGISAAVAPDEYPKTYEVTVSIVDLGEGVFEPEFVNPITGEVGGYVPHAPVAQTFVLTVTNTAPVFQMPLADQATLIDTLGSYQILATDPDGHALTYSITGVLPVGLNYVGGGLIQGTATAATAPLPITVTVSDGYGGSVSGTFSWKVFTNRAPLCTATATPARIWPPNHKMVQIGITGVTDPDGDPVTITVTGIQQDEPTTTVGDGNTSTDGAMTNGRAYVRAERAGTPKVPGDGRVYEIFYQASDGKPGGTCTGTVTVGVPHDLGKGKLVVPSPGRWDSLTGQKF